MKFRTLRPAWILACLALFVAIPSHADRMNKYEFSLQVPYLFDESIEFDGGATAEIASDPGFGFTAGYNYSNNINLRASFTWNDTRYDGQRILDDGANTVDTISGVMDTVSVSGVADYYFSDGKFSPFVSGMIGWTNIDTNIPAGPVNEVCWWDPWWGYVCDWYQPTYGGDYFSWGVGAGLRFDLTSNHFIRAGYYERWLDIDYTSDSPSVGSAIFEFGFMY